MMRVVIAGLLVVVAAIAVLQWTAKDLIMHLLKSQLEANEIELVSISIAELKLLNLKLHSVEIKTKDWQVKAEGVDAFLSFDGEVVVKIRDAKIKLTPQNSSEDAQSIEALLETVDTAIGGLPVSGQMDRVEYCQPGVCLPLNVRWQRQGQALKASLWLPIEGVWLEVEKKHSWSLSAVVRQESAEVLIDASLSHSENLLTLESSLHAGLPHSLQFDPAEIDLRSLAVTGVSRLPLQTKLDEIVAELLSSHQVSAVAKVLLNEGDLAVFAEGAYQARFDYADQDVAITFVDVPEFQVSFGDLASGVFAIGSEEQCSLSLGLGIAQCELSSVASRWDVQHELGKFAGDIMLSGWQIEWVDDELYSNGTAELSLFDLSEGRELLAGNIKFDYGDDKIELQSEAIRLLAAELKLSLAHKLSDAIGHAEVSLNDSGNLGATLQYGLAKSDTESDIAQAIDGEYQLDSTISWNLEAAPVLSHESQLTLNSLSLNYDGYEMNSGEMVIHASGFPMVSAELLFETHLLDVGVPLSGMEANLALGYDSDNGQLSVQGRKLKFDLFGGQVSTSELNYRYPQGSGAAVLTLQSLQLAELLALQQQDLNATGLLSGSVPVQFTDGNMSVESAQIAAESPGGFIQYEAEASVLELAKSNAGVEVVLEAMKNFQYHALQATVDYAADGKMLAKTSLKGANPNYQGGREVHLNLNLEENILVLLKSLRLGSDIAEQISEKRG